MEDAQLRTYAESLAASGVTADQLATMLRESRQPEAATSMPEPASTPEPQADEALARAQAALDAQARRDTLAEGATAILRERGLDLAWDEYAPDELIHLAGLGDDPRETRADKVRREKLERDNAIASDPSALKRHLHQQDVEAYSQGYWQLGRDERVREAERLGIDLSTYQPPQQFNGLR